MLSAEQLKTIIKEKKKNGRGEMQRGEKRRG